MKLDELVAFLGDPERLWALPAGYLPRYLARAEAYDGPPLEAVARGSAMRAEGNVAVLGVSGPIDYRPSFFTALFGGAAITSLQRDFRQAMDDPGVKAIVLAFDSPGGSVIGVSELAAEIAAARGTKPIIAQIDPMAASAAAWLALSADEVVMMRSGITGALGIITRHADLSGALEQEGVKITEVYAPEFKAEGSSVGPLSAADHAAMKVRVEAMYAQMVKDNAIGRKVTQTAAREKFGQGRVMNAQQALNAGLIDGFGTLESTITNLLLGRKAASALKAEGEPSELEPAPPRSVHPDGDDPDVDGLVAREAWATRLRLRGLL